MWLSDKKNNKTNLSRDELFSLLSYHQQAEWNALDRYAQHKNILAGAMIALLGAGGASLLASDIAMYLFAFILPIFVVKLRRYAIDTLDRYYRRFLEAVVCSSKIEFLLGLYRPVWPEKLDPPLDPNGAVPFIEDEVLGINRHLKSQVKESTCWITSLMSKGHNDVSWRLFRAICISSFVIPIVGLILINDASFLPISVTLSVLAALLYLYDSRKITTERKITSLNKEERKAKR